MSDILNIGMTSLIAYQFALNSTSQNISNSSTEFYSRREINFAEAMFNNGVKISDISRVYDLATSNRLQKSNSQFAMNNFYYQQLSTLETLVDNSNGKTNVSTYLNNALKSIEQLNTDPQSIGSRGVFLNQLNILSNQFNYLSQQINQQQINCNTSLSNMVDQVNQLLQNIANINQSIPNANNQELQSLLDQQEQSLQKLATYFDFSRTRDNNGLLNITVGNGIQLIFGFNAAQLKTQPDPTNPTNLEIAINNSGMSLSANNNLMGGQLQGLLAFRDTNLSQTKIQLDRMSLAISQAFNTQNKLGIDYNGNLGGNIFTDINSINAINDRSIANVNNNGDENLSVTINDVSQLSTSNYQLVFDTNSHYSLMRINDNQIVSSGTISSLPQQINVDGFSLNINSGTIVAGDRFIIAPTQNGAGAMKVAITDPKLIALGSPVISSPNSSNSGNGKITTGNIIDTSNMAFSLPNQLNPPITVKFLSATTFQLINTNNNTVIEGPITYDPVNGSSIFPTPGLYDPGYRISLSGDMKAGDTFNIEYNMKGMSDDRNGLLLADLFKNPILDNHSINFTSAFNALSNNVSVATNSLNSQMASSEIILNSAQEDYDQISGVSLQEEQVNLIHYQECFQASAQILQAAKTVFDIIISLGRG